MADEKKYKGSVLLVEDTLAMLDANRRILEHEGCRVFIAENIAEAREVLSQNTINAAVLDIMLPDGDGLHDLFPHIKENYNIPVLFLTAKSKQDDVCAGLEAGGFDYMTKPYHERELCLRVMRMLDVSRSNQLREFILAHKLTSVEQKVSRLVAAGLINKQIADKMGLSEVRIKQCLTSIYHKLEISEDDKEKRNKLVGILKEHGEG